MTYQEFNEAYGFEQKAGFQLMPLQIEDIEQFGKWRKSLNRYEVGSGKTVISTVVHLMSQSTMAVVIVPPILLLSWQRWLDKVSGNVLMYKGTPKQRKEMTLADKRWVIMSHDIFRRDFERVYAELQGIDVELIVDEAQALKSPKSKLYINCGIFTMGRRMQKLSGTPTSKPEDCYTFIRLDSPDIYRSYAHFEHVHIAERDFFGSIKAYQNLDFLAENFALRSIRRSKKEVHGYDNPPMFPDTTYELAPDHYKLYEQLVEEQLLIFDDGSKIDATSAHKLRQACQQIVVNYDYFSNDPSKRSTTYDLIDLTIEQTDCLTIGSSKLIIWTIYRMTSRAVLKYLKDKGIYAVGAYSEVDSNKSFEAFMGDDNCRIGVFNPQSAGAGLNPQAVCWESLYIETSTTPMLSRQSLGRLDRVGQTHVPTMRFGVAKGTVQEALLEQLMTNDELVTRVEKLETKETLRNLLLGRK